MEEYHQKIKNWRRNRLNLTDELRLKIKVTFQDESDELASLNEKIISWSKMLKEEQKQLDNRRKLESADNRASPSQAALDRPAPVVQKVKKKLGAKPKTIRANPKKQQNAKDNWDKYYLRD